MSVAPRIPGWLELREGSAPIVVVAPHGGRRQRPRRHGDSVNDLHTAAIARALAEALDAGALINHGLDRNEIDLNRISHLAEHAPVIPALLRVAIERASRDGATPLVLFVHGWNMTVRCCDIGVGLVRRGGRLLGRWPTLGPAAFDSLVGAIERELESRDISVGIGRRYAASGADNATQMFSGRHVEHANADVAWLARLAARGGVDAAQLELGIPVRWEGSCRDALVEGLVAALGSKRPAARLPREREAWPSLLGTIAPPSQSPPEPGYSIQAVFPGGRCGLFAGVEATSPHAMVSRLCLVDREGPMLLFVGEGPWSGASGSYEMEGFSWSATPRGVRMRFAGPMVEYPDHDAYLDLEEGLARSRLRHAELELDFEHSGTGSVGRLTGSIRAADFRLDPSQAAFLDRGRRRGLDGGNRVRLFASTDGYEDVRVEARLTPGDTEGAAIKFVSDAPSDLERIEVLDRGAAVREGRVTARVPVWRDGPGGLRVRATFGMARYLVEDAGGSRWIDGLFDRLEIFPGSADATAEVSQA